MQIQKLSQEKNKLNLTIKNTNHVFINTIRRTIIEEVPTLAIENITFIKNDSALYDEIIAHRLGLIPLKTDLKTYNIKKECSCKNGCEKCQLTFKLTAKGPKTVYASDLKIKDKAITPVYPKTPIVILLKKQNLELEGTIELNKGKEHTKWSPALTYYKHLPQITINEKCNLCKKCIQKCPQNIIKLENKKIKITNPEKCILCKACTDICSQNAIQLKTDNTFILYIESFGQLTPKQILLKSTEILNQKIDTFIKLLK